MTTDTVDNYRPRIEFGQLVDGVRSELKDAGLMHPLPQQRFEIAIAREVELSRDVAQGQLKRNWNRLFPGVQYSDEIMLEKLDAAIDRWKAEAVVHFQELAQREENIKLVRNFFTGKSFFLRRWDVRLLVASAASVVTFPFWAMQIIAPTNWQLSLGSWGLSLNLALLAVLFVQAYRYKGGSTS